MMCVNLIIVHLKINITFPNNLGANWIAPSPNKDESQENNESMVKEVHGECGSISIHCPLCTCTCSQSHLTDTHVLFAIISLLLIIY